MTISNKLTISRICIVPIMVLVTLIKPLQEIDMFLGLNLSEFLFAILFVIASITDFLDGYLARKRNEITDFGKFLDPIADKVLTLAAMLYIVQFKTPYQFWWILILIVVTREFVVSAVRMIAASKNIVIAASIYGKIKTVITTITLFLILFNGFGLYTWITDSLFYLTVLVTLLSGIDYVIKNKIVFSGTK